MSVKLSIIRSKSFLKEYSRLMNQCIVHLFINNNKVQKNNSMSGFTSLICGVPQGSVLGPMKICS